jgi:hypothetical protein
MQFITSEFLLSLEEDTYQDSPIDRYYLLNTLERYKHISRLMTGSGTASAMDGGLWLKALKNDLAIPGLESLCNLQVPKIYLLLA